jgi:hypothetical protein
MCGHAGYPRLRSDSYEALLTGSLDPENSPTRTTQGRVGRPPSLIHLLTNKAFNATTSTNVVTAPPAWEQRPRLITLFTAHPEMDSEKVQLFMPRQALFSHRRPSTHKTTVVPGFPGARPYPFLNNPRSYVPTWPRPPSVNKGMTPARQPQGVARPLQHPGCPPVPSSTLPRRPRDGLHTPGHVATVAPTVPILPSSLSHPLGFCCKPRPSSCVYKRGGQGVL